MKLIITIPTGYTLHDIDECFPHYIKQYELNGHTLQVWIKHNSNVIPELITLTLMSEGQEHKYTIVYRLGVFVLKAEYTSPEIELQIVV